MTPRSGALPRPEFLEPVHECTVEVELRASPGAVYEAWTQRFDLWFAARGSLQMRAVVDEPFFFETEHEGRRHAHYGRFLTLDPDHVVELTWVTGEPGTHGNETVVLLELEPSGLGSRARLSHVGFRDEVDADRHREAWPIVFKHLDDTLAT
jgi:uncharacterized protein YndB with AHSA1/START domain